MKKLCIALLVFVGTLSMATAQITLGAKGIFGIGVGTTIEGFLKEQVENDPQVKEKNVIGGGGGVFFRYNLPFFSSLGFQTELDVVARNGIKIVDDGYTQRTMIMSYTSLELPLLITYDFALGPVCLTLLAGPHISFPLGTMKAENNTEPQEPASIDSKALVGITVGTAVAIPVGPGAIVTDIRYLNDFSKLKVETSYPETPLMDILTRRALQVSLGYQFTF